MKNNIKRSALFVSVISAVSMLSVSVPASMNASASEPDKIDVSAVMNAEFSIASYMPKYDFGKRGSYGSDGQNDYYDFLVIENEINELYAARNYPENKLSCSEVTLSQEAKDSGITPEMLDLSGDGLLSPEDYCIYLRALSKDYSVKFNVEETGAEIKSYNGKNYSEIVVPGSVYNDEYAVILPVIAINSNAFSSCSKLTTVYLNDYHQPNWKNCLGQPMNPEHKIMASSFLNVRDNAFAGCSNLTDVYFPQNIVMNDKYDNPVDGFAGTPFSNDKDHHFNINGVEYYRDSDTSDPKVFADVYTHYSLQNGKELGFIDETTSINDNFVKSMRRGLKSYITGIDIPEDIRYIGWKAFAGSENLDTVNGSTYSALGSDMKNTIKRFINAFDMTEFMDRETQAMLDDIVNELAKDGITRNSSDEEKELAAAKKIIERISYSEYNSVKGFSLYPDCLYNSFDYSRKNYISENAGLHTGYTMCGGISQTYSLLLDMLDVKNYCVGGNKHYFNVVNIDGSWYACDLSDPCNYCNRLLKANHALDYKAENARYRANLSVSDINSDLMRYDANLYGEPVFRFFEASKDRQFTDENNVYYFVLKDTDRSKLLVYRYAGEDGWTSDKDALDQRIKKLNDDSISTISIDGSVVRVGNIVYFIANEYLKEEQNDAAYAAAAKGNPKFRDWSRSYQNKPVTQ
ncbi:MAG: leucine-rich repeat protein [Ruminococcus sp.]|nr:leucine-rich repeat protein [Ruminococcus sp.]